MANTHIRDVDDALLDEYRLAARVAGRSLQAELRAGLERGRPPKHRRSREELLELSRRLTEGQSVGADSTPYIRWARDTDGGRYLGREKPLDADH